MPSKLNKNIANLYVLNFFKIKTSKMFGNLNTVRLVYKQQKLIKPSIKFEL